MMLVVKANMAHSVMVPETAHSQRFYVPARKAEHKPKQQQSTFTTSSTQCQITKDRTRGWRCVRLHQKHEEKFKWKKKLRFRVFV